MFVSWAGHNGCCRGHGCRACQPYPNRTRRGLSCAVVAVNDPNFVCAHATTCRCNLWRSFLNFCSCPWQATTANTVRMAAVRAARTPDELAEVYLWLCVAAVLKLCPHIQPLAVASSLCRNMCTHVPLLFCFPQILRKNSTAHKAARLSLKQRMEQIACCQECTCIDDRVDRSEKDIAPPPR